MCRTTTLVALFALVLPATAQDAPKRQIEATITGASSDTIYLANYYGSKLYYADTAIADARGKAVFHSPKGYASGLYAIVAPGLKFFQVLVNEPVIKFATDTTDLVKHLEVKVSKENQVYLDYIRYLDDRKKERDLLRTQLEEQQDATARNSFKAKLEDLDKAVKAYQDELMAKNPGTLVAAMVKMSMVVELPEIRKADGSLDSAAQYYQYRAHYWDNVDLKDERIVRLPDFARQVRWYIGRTVPQVPDTINAHADALIGRTDGRNEVFKYMVNTITHKYKRPATSWAWTPCSYTWPSPTSAPTAPHPAAWTGWPRTSWKLCERAHKQAPLVLGRKAPYLCLTDTTEEKWIDFYDLPQEYVAIIFWDPHCGHCKKELPEWGKVYKEKMKALDIEVYCVAKAVDSTLMKDWKAFIREHELDWVNVGLTQRDC
ncbi:MAG: redoxin domain-containing protein [Flavobacteriales bacterium]|nr:redoxin domain-containing protein [Flavobacteriales bacterium]